MIRKGLNLSKTVCIAVLLVFSGTQLQAQSQGLSKEDAKLMIKTMCEKDQELRKALGKGDRTDSLAYAQLKTTVAQMDEMHNIMLHKVIKEQGYPPASEFGMTTTHDFWILIMHQDTDVELQQAVLDWMKSVLFQGEVIGRDVAYLTDRVAVNKGECQTYGTQFRYDDVQDKNLPFEICEKKKLKKLRKKIGLMPFETQVNRENKG